MRRALGTLLGASALGLALSGVAFGWTAAGGKADLAAIETRLRSLSSAPTRDRQALAELDARARALAAEASRALGAMREQAVERDADMAAVVAGSEWRETEALLLELRFRIAAIELERALAGDPARASLARSAADAFGSFVEAPDPDLAAEARYGRGLARIAAGERDGGIEDLRAAATVPSVAPRARLALAERLADAGQSGQALDLVTRQIAAGGLPRDLTLRAKLLRLKLLIAAGGAGRVAGKSSGAASQAGGSAGGGEVAALGAELLGAGEPWRGAVRALFAGNEDLLPAGPDADAAALRLRAEAAARRGDARAALEAYRIVIARADGRDDTAALAGLARAALANESFAEARAATSRLREIGQPWTRELALIDLRAAYGAWQASPDQPSAAAVMAAADAVAGAIGASAEDRAEAGYRRSDVLRAAGDLDGAIAGFAAVETPPWRAPARLAALQSRALRHARDPRREPRGPLLRDLATFLATPDLAPDARATAIVLDAALRAADEPALAEGDAQELDPAQQRAALARLREIDRLGPKAAAVLPSSLRARAMLELRLGESPDPAMLGVLPEASRAAVAAEIAADLREDIARAASTEASRERARRALGAALAFTALAPEPDRDAARLELAEQALELGDAATAASLFRTESERQPRSLSALRGLAVAAAESGDPTTARAAWDRLAAVPDLPPALREEVDRQRRSADRPR